MEEKELQDKLANQAKELERQTQEMLQLERDIAYDIMAENVERSEQEILNDDEQMIEKSDITAVGVVVPEMLVTEEDQDEDASAFMAAQGRAFGGAL